MTHECDCGARYGTVDELHRCAENDHGWKSPEKSYDEVLADARCAFEFEYLQKHLTEKNPNADYLMRKPSDATQRITVYSYPNIEESWRTFRAGFLLARGWRPDTRTRITGNTENLPRRGP